MRLRKQRHVRSCGIACVAMIANKAYDTVLQDFIDLGNDPIYWEWSDRKKAWVLNYSTTAHDLHYLLAHYGVKSNRNQKRYTDYKDLPNTAILAVDRRKETVGGRTRTHWHWVVWHNKEIYDPSHGRHGQYYYDSLIWSYIRIY